MRNLEGGEGKSVEDSSRLRVSIDSAICTGIE